MKKTEMKPLDAAKALLREWTQYGTGWNEITFTVKKDEEGNIVDVGRTAKIIRVTPDWLGMDYPFYVELDPVRPVITKGEDGSINYDYTDKV